MEFSLSYWLSYNNDFHFRDSEVSDCNLPFAKSKLISGKRFLVSSLIFTYSLCLVPVENTMIRERFDQEISLENRL